MQYLIQRYTRSKTIGINANGSMPGAHTVRNRVPIIKRNRVQKASSTTTQ